MDPRSLRLIQEYVPTGASVAADADAAAAGPADAATLPMLVIRSFTLMLVRALENNAKNREISQ